ncbi:hypothetical protein [Streptomyces cacaoi]|uniref:hypothetical protein n=1 Tax=Streptomyces cacaoi TaxID=1898 RepID=UPI00374A64A4
MSWSLVADGDSKADHRADADAGVPRGPNRNLVTRVRRTPYSYTSGITVSEAIAIAAYLTMIGADRPTTP